MTKKGRKPVEVNIDQVERLAAQGLTHDQIASVLGIANSTLYKNKANNPELAEAIKRGQDKGIAKVTNSLFENAVSGNLGAQVFYLKNRAGWVDRTDHKHSGEVGINDLSDTERNHRILEILDSARKRGTRQTSTGRNRKVDTPASPGSRVKH